MNGRIFHLKTLYVKDIWQTFGYLDSISAARSNKYFKAKRIRDDLMLDALEKKEEDIEKSSCQTMKSLKPMEVIWTTGQEQELKR